MTTVRVASNRQIVVDHEGHTFPLFIGEDGHYYLYDPRLLLDLEHTSLPVSSRRNVVESAPGLGVIPTREILSTAIPAALAFVPVVGPILAPIAAIAAKLTTNMFGGTDPSGMSMQQLQDYSIQLRQAIVDLHKSLGVPDAMPTLPAGHSYSKDWPDQAIILELYPQNIGITDPNHWRCGKEPGVSCPGCGGIRVCSHDVIARLTPVYQQLAAQVHDQQLTQQVLSVVGQQGVAPQTAPLSTSGGAPAPVMSSPTYYPSGGGGDGFVAPSGAPPSAETLRASMLSDAEGMLPLLLGGVALIVALTQSHGGGRARKRA